MFHVEQCLSCGQFSLVHEADDWMQWAKCRECQAVFYIKSLFPQQAPESSESPSPHHQ